MTTNPQWAGHPWSTAEHRTVGRRASCQGCGQWCYRIDGCWCCNEPAYTYLLAESRWEAGYVRGVLAEVTRLQRQPDLDGLEDARTLHQFPWEQPR